MDNRNNWMRRRIFSLRLKFFMHHQRKQELVERRGQQEQRSQSTIMTRALRDCSHVISGSISRHFYRIHSCSVFVVSIFRTPSVKI